MTDTLYPLEFVVSGTPRSLAARGPSRDVWMRAVAMAARDRIQAMDVVDFLDDRPLAVTIFYFLNQAMAGDVDNIVKPILDALNRLAYPDDGVVERVVVQRFEPGVGKVFSLVSDTLVQAVEAEPPLVYIRIDDDLSWRNL